METFIKGITLQSHNQESVGDDNEDELFDANEVTNDMTLRDVVFEIFDVDNDDNGNIDVIDSDEKDVSMSFLIDNIF
ncbi:1556_t:CDS:2 [Entrophospora sp. SA101]|nr:1556_t:CDS:2 [Entrophospora sp. SA101]